MKIWTSLIIAIVLWWCVFYAYNTVFSQSPRAQTAVNLTAMRRPWVVSRRMAARMRLQTLDGKGVQYVTPFVLGEDSEKYALDDVLAGALEILEEPKK